MGDSRCVFCFSIDVAVVFAFSFVVEAPPSAAAAELVVMLLLPWGSRAVDLNRCPECFLRKRREETLKVTEVVAGTAADLQEPTMERMPIMTLTVLFVGWGESTS